MADILNSTVSSHLVVWKERKHVGKLPEDADGCQYQFKLDEMNREISCFCHLLIDAVTIG